MLIRVVLVVVEEDVDVVVDEVVELEVVVDVVVVLVVVICVVVVDVELEVVEVDVDVVLVVDVVVGVFCLRLSARLKLYALLQELKKTIKSKKTNTLAIFVKNMSPPKKYAKPLMGFSFRDRLSP